MKKQSTIGTAALIAAALAASASARAVNFEGTAVGAWLNPDVGAEDVWVINNSDDSPGVASFGWGIGSQTPFNNQFTFDGVGSDGGGVTWLAIDDQPFKVGDFTYRNGDVIFGATVNGVDLAVTLTITDPNLGPQSAFTFEFDITNTPNDSGDPTVDGDIVTVTSGVSNTSFDYLGETYTLELLGFSNDDGATIVSDFSSPEGQTASAGLYARIVPPTDIPDTGATLAMLGLGLLGVGMIRRKA